MEALQYVIWYAIGSGHGKMGGILILELNLLILLRATTSRVTHNYNLARLKIKFTVANTPTQRIDDDPNTTTT